MIVCPDTQRCRQEALAVFEEIADLREEIKGKDHCRPGTTWQMELCRFYHGYARHPGPRPSSELTLANRFDVLEPSEEEWR